MKRGPQKGRGSNGDTRSFAEKAALAWHQKVPEWVSALAQLADAHSLEAAGKAIGYSGSLVSSVLNNKYAGDVARVAEKVQGALLGRVVDCPRLGEMARNTCLDWQKKPLVATSSLRVQMYHACRDGCPNFRAGSNTPLPLSQPSKAPAGPTGRGTPSRLPGEYTSGGDDER